LSAARRRERTAARRGHGAALERKSARPLPRRAAPFNGPADGASGVSGMAATA